MTRRGRFTEKSFRLDPAIFQTLYGWARMEEADRNFARAGELLDAANRLSPGNASVLLHRAVLHGRVKDYDKALAALDDIEWRREGGGLTPIESSEKGLLLDRMGRHAQAFAAFSEGKRSLRALTGQSYMAEEAAALASRLTAFLVRRGSKFCREPASGPTSRSRSSSLAFPGRARL